MAKSSRCVAVVVALVLGVCLAACESNVTKENFAKIKVGMTQGEVERILGGSGTEDSAPPGMGISSGSIATTKDAPDEKVYVWKDGGYKIIVTFKSGKVVMMNQVGE